MRAFTTPRAAVPALVALSAAAAVGLPSTHAAAAPAASTHCHSKASADSDGDGRSDPVIGVPGKTTAAAAKAGQVVAFHGTRKGIKPVKVFRQGEHGVPGTASNKSHFGESIASGDFNGDGCADAAIAAVNNITVLYGKLHKGLGTDGAQLLTIDSLGLAGLNNPDPAEANASIGDPTVGDFNGDGHDDLALIYSVSDEATTSAVVVVPGSAHGLRQSRTTAFTEGSPQVPTSGADGIGPFSAGDVNHDGYSDLAVPVTGSQPGQVDLMYGAKHGLASGHRTQQVKLTPRAVALGDFNGDGYDDLAVPVLKYPSHESLVILRGSKHGVRTHHEQTFKAGHDGFKKVPARGFGRNPVAGDFNRDGDDDLVFGGMVTVMAGTKHGLTTKGIRYWRPSSHAVPGKPSDTGSSFGSNVMVGNYGRGPGEDVLIASQNGYDGAGSVCEFFGSTTRNIGLRAKHAKLITEDTRGVPGAATSGDEFGGQGNFA